MKKTLYTGAIAMALSSSAWALNPQGSDAALLGRNLPLERHAQDEQVLGMHQIRALRSAQEAQSILLTLVDIEIEGADHLPETLRQTWVQPLLRKQSITWWDVENLRLLLQSWYQQQGYLLTQVIYPEQDIDKSAAHVRLQVVEGHLGEVVDETGWDEALQYQTYVHAMQVWDRIDFRQLNRQLRLMNRLPGVRVRSVLKKGALPGQTNIHLVGERQRLQGFWAVDTFGSAPIGKTQYGFGGTWNQLSPGSADKLSLQVAANNKMFHNMHFVRAEYSWVPYRSQGGQWTLWAEDAFSRPGNDLAVLGLKSHAHKYGLDISYPLTLGGALTALWKCGAVYSSSQTHSSFSENFSSHDENRALFGQLLFQGKGWKTDWQLSTKLTQGLPIFHGTEGTESTPSSRQGATSSYTKFNIDAALRTRVTRLLSLSAQMSAQWGSCTLMGSDTLSYGGGGGYGIGYQPSSLSGDSGCLGRFELSHAVQRKLPGVRQLEPYMAYDTGLFYNYASGRVGHAHGYSLGARWVFENDWVLQTAMAWPRSADVSYQNKTTARYYMSLRSQF